MHKKAGPDTAGTSSINSGKLLSLEREKIIGVAPYILVVVLMLGFYAYSPKFLSYENILILMTQSSVLLLVATAATFPILMASIDLSVASMVNLTGIVTALLVPKFGVMAAVPAILLGAGFGFMNGLAYVGFKLPSLLVTLGTMFIMEGASLLLSGGTPIWFKNEQFTWIAKGILFFNVQNIVVWSVIVYLIFVFINGYTKFGRYTVAIGGGEKVAKLSGVNVAKYKVIAFVFSGLLCGIAGVLLTARVESASPFLGKSLLLDSIAAAVIGGTALSGGVGGVQKTFVGVLVISILSNGLDISFVHPYHQTIIKGLVVVAAVAATLDRSKMTLFK